MKIAIPTWIKVSGKYILGGAAAVVGLLWIQSGQSPEELAKAVQIYMTADSIMIVENGDTVQRELNEMDKCQMFRRRFGSVYDNGYTQHIWNYQTIDLLTGDVTPQYVVSSIPAIGTQVNWKIRSGKAELATEKIPEKLDGLPLDKAAEQGYYSVVDTTIYLDSLGKEIKRVSVKLWTKDAEQKPAIVIVPFDAIKEVTDVQ